MVRASDDPFTIRMRIGCFGPGTILDEIILTEVDRFVKDADVVALVRLDSVEDQYQPRVGDGYCGSVIAFRATILDAVKDRRSRGQGPISFVLFGHERSYEPGEDYVAILRWQPGTRTYRVMSRAYFMLVKDGRVRWPGGDKSESLPDVLTRLRSISQK